MQKQSTPLSKQKLHQIDITSALGAESLISRALNEIHELQCGLSDDWIAIFQADLVDYNAPIIYSSPYNADMSVALLLLTSNSDETLSWVFDKFHDKIDLNKVYFHYSLNANLTLLEYLLVVPQHPSCKARIDKLLQYGAKITPKCFECIFISTTINRDILPFNENEINTFNYLYSYAKTHPADYSPEDLKSFLTSAFKYIICLTYDPNIKQLIKDLFKTEPEATETFID